MSTLTPAHVTINPRVPGLHKVAWKGWHAIQDVLETRDPDQTLIPDPGVAAQLHDAVEAAMVSAATQATNAFLDALP